MTLPATPTVRIRFTNNAIFADGLVLGTGVLGTNVLGDITSSTINTVQSVDTRRGRSNLDDVINPGNAIVAFRDIDGTWNPQDPTSPIYGKVIPNQQLQISVGATNLFCGYISQYIYRWDIGADYANVIVVAQDALNLFNRVDIDTVANTSAGQTAGPRLDNILDQIGWPAAGRNLNTGSITLQDDPGGSRTALAAMHTVEQSELGGLFINVDGIVTFIDAAAIATAAASADILFADDGTGEEYRRVEINLDDTRIYNDVTVQRVGGTAQTAQDATSIDQYYLRSYNRTQLLMQTDSDALDQAQTLVDYYAEPRLRLDSVTFDVYDSAGLANATAVDLFNSVRVRKTYSSSDVIEFASTIQGIDHEIRPDRWITTFTTVEPISTAFILGDNDFGILGVNILT